MFQRFVWEPCYDPADHRLNRASIPDSMITISKKTEENREQVLFILLSCFVLLSLLPTVLMEFAHHDQYLYFTINSHQKTCDQDTQFKGLFFDLGRPFGALFECLIFKNVHYLGDLTFWRLICLGVLA